MNLDRLFALKTPSGGWPFACFSALVIGVMCIILALIMFAPSVGASHSLVKLTLGLQLLPTLYLVIRAVLVRRLRRRVRDHNGFLCFNCNYPLHGLARSGACPECGHAYTMSEVQTKWSTAIPGWQPRRETF